MKRPVFLRSAGVRPVRLPRCRGGDVSRGLGRHHAAGQASVEAIIIVVALIGGAVGLGLFGEDGGLASAFVDGLRRFQRGFGYALSLAG
ncbi:hypothetical protein FXN63_18355 [Pigmentiphaga aceris]|uniref:Uncharacterized protein n=1 Tax=Pigmentiphaga aceris TaxID=1940612 RepID=A0A5C0B302_9BURK|nr:hypothetical protein [Pigmentiphaga aceris]QEI07580.1 hypothetical protein FXN63_18355 [Pigmentiphaga aceris]